MKKPLIIAHRGASFYEPENTLRAVKRALEFGVDGVEIDVRSTIEGNIVVIHDETVERTTNGGGRVRDMSLVELRSLDAGKGEKIPLLEEVLELVGNKAMLIIELKTGGIEERVLSIVEKYNALDRVMFSSFIHGSVKRVKELNSRVKTGVIIRSSPINPSVLALDARAENICAFYKYVSWEMVQNVHGHGLNIFAWTVDDANTAENLIMLGVDGIVTNKPDIITRNNP
ncbi:MAG: glycerophosphodiester phosphodiesterase [Candidatus Freyarchaeota archaeon]|nr:glycerophosphodiester phosphodiesterase [Candidatus Jordarchaeia archaeon]MBS7269893.1 glycerophosphodiester phosphodiesterase [Candidatus Jordarchaeia archaeon]MBS7279193.1 glycerophosphodiester phosphodiesterase [Candidatus Jordarchaeia archaeon]